MENNKVLNDIVSYIKELHQQTIDLIKKQHEEKLSLKQTQSIEIKEVASALCKAQQEMQIASRDAFNPHFKSKYADWQCVHEAAQPYLNQHGLSVTLYFHDEPDVLYLVCHIIHTSGQWLKSFFPFKPPFPQDPQKVASYNTYMKRMVYANMVCINIGEADDDGNDASTPPEVTKSHPPIPRTPPQLILPHHLEELHYELNGYPHIADRILKGFKIQSLDQMWEQSYRATLDKIREIKEAESKVKVNNTHL